MKFLIVILLFPLSSLAQTFDICDTIFKVSNLGCNNRGASNALGGSYPLLYDAFNANPSSIPVSRTPLGVEYTNTAGTSNYAIIKGQNHIGGGFSLKDSNSTFFGPYENYKVAIKEKEGEQGYQPRTLDPNLNFGTAINLLRLKDIAAPIGISYKYNSEKQVWAPTLGFSIRTGVFTLGASAYKEKPERGEDENYITEEKNEVISMAVGIKHKNIMIDYTRFTQKTEIDYQSKITLPGQETNLASRYIVSTEILSATLVFKHLNISYAFRKQDDSRVKDSSELNIINSFGSSYNTIHQLFGATLRFPKYLSVGYYHNYELQQGSSVIVQLYLPVRF